ncbi:LysR family transcriptional regulator [Pseudomonas fluorescens]|uniref:LysR family transcriptional regulator n=1 Tax=Pseudomonas fluorescens TaxID=294 RepID=A0A327MPS0_PSEFL|nr:LysR substrate-binding domain-containing protein [Pseudomonas fluorescens]RAI64831.1 LysR family transcriptional regulator [Pseudomonas fluorescens]
MEFKQLKYFAKIAELGNMTRASEALCIAQPALSQQIANLEAELNTRLFDRGVYGARLTSSGEVLYGYAKSLLRQLNDVRQAVSNEAEHPTGRTAIGIPGSTAKMLAEPLLRNVLAEGTILLEIVERPSAELVDFVAAGKLDLAITVDAQPRRGARITPLFTEEMYAVLPKAAAAGKKSLKLKDVAASPLILPSAPSTIRQRVEAALLNSHLKYEIVSEVSSTDLLIRLVSAGLGWTVLPWSALAEDVERYGRIDALPISGHKLEREISLCSSDTLPLSRAAEVVQTHVVNILRSLVGQGEWRGTRFVTDSYP